VDRTDFPRLTQQFLSDTDDMSELTSVLQAEDPADALSALVREHFDSDALEPELKDIMFEAIDLQNSTHANFDVDAWENEGQTLQKSLADDEELMAWARETFGDEFEIRDEDGAEADATTAGDAAAQGSADEKDDAKAADAEAAGRGSVDESDLEVSDDKVARDWRQLQKLLTQKDEEETGLPYYESRSVAPVKVPTYNEAGDNALEDIFGISLDSPRQHMQAKSRKTFYPGQTYTPEDLNPHTERGGGEPMDPAKLLAKKKFQSLMRQRTRKDPFKAGKISLPTMRDVGVLSRFVSERGKIISRRRTGCTAKNQRHVKRTIKRARAFGLMPYTSRLQHPSTQEATSHHVEMSTRGLA
jgi:small subunit ribosomal protein S18